MKQGNFISLENRNFGGKRSIGACEKGKFFILFKRFSGQNSDSPLHTTRYE